jgi:hypothetical protein
VPRVILVGILCGRKVADLQKALNEPAAMEALFEKIVLAPGETQPDRLLVELYDATRMHPPGGRV